MNTVLDIPDDPGDFRLENFNVNDVRTYLAKGRENVKQIIIKFTGRLTEDQRAVVMKAFLAPAPTGGATPLTTTFLNPQKK